MSDQHVGRTPHLHRRPGQCGPLFRATGGHQRGQPLPVFPRCTRSLVQAPAGRGAGALLRRKFFWPLLVGHPLRRHHDRRHLPRCLLLGTHHHHQRPPGRFSPAHVHRHGQAQARRAAQGGCASHRPREPAEFRTHHPRAHQRCAGPFTPGRDLQLGGQGLHRAHHPDAGDPVRLSLRGARQTDLLVRHRHGGSRHGADRLGRRAQGRYCSNAWSISPACGTNG